MTTTILTETDIAQSEGAHTIRWWKRGDVIGAVLGFLVFAVLVLTRATALLEPDDYAYRASIVALSHGHILLTNAQYIALNKELASTGGQGILQWHHLSSGKWISEKNPGYPFFAVIFYMLGLLRITPLFYGALACVGLFAGARAWLGRWAGTIAVWLYCFSGAALTFAWRATMPSFTDASLIAFGFGTLLWVYVSSQTSQRTRCIIGLLGFLGIEGAVFIRYTNVVELGVAILGAAALARTCQITWRTLAVWGTSVLGLGLLVLGFDKWAYGSATSTGYSAGEITFSFKALWPNLKGMPKYLTTSMPFWIVAALALIAIIINAVRQHGAEPGADARHRARRDLVVGGLLALGWLGLWFLYLNYTWTANMVGGGGGPGGGGSTVHVIRFYLPTLGLISLLATWLLVRLHRLITWPLLGAIAIAAVLSFHSMATSGIPGGHLGGPAVGGPGNGPHSSSSYGYGGPPPNGVPSHSGSGAPPGAGSGAPPGAGPGTAG